VVVVCEEVLAEHLQPLHGLSMRPLAQHARVQVLPETRVKSASERTKRKGVSRSNATIKGCRKARGVNFSFMSPEAEFVKNINLSVVLLIKLQN
jgi:hypothetical protein